MAAAPILPSSSNFLGVALIINRSRDGPRLVFHYPQHIQPATPRSGSGGRKGNTVKRSGGDEEDGDDEDDVLLEKLNLSGLQPFSGAGASCGTGPGGLGVIGLGGGSSSSGGGGGVANSPGSGTGTGGGGGGGSGGGTGGGGGAGRADDFFDYARWNHDDHVETGAGSQIVPWEHVAGYPTKDLEALLTPTRAYHKKLFQVSLDQLTCVSCPIYVPEHGVWRKRRKQPRARPSVSSRPSAGGGVTGPDDGYFNARTQDGDGEFSGLDDTFLAEGRRSGTPLVEEPASVAVTDAPDEEKKSGMTMFNLVFILHPKKHEARELVDTLYFHIIRKVNTPYKYAQQRSDFVWKESKRVLQLKDKGREERTRMSTLWREILSTSSLAASLQDIYDAVSANKIAALQLDTAEGAVTHSVQIPMPFYVPDLPPPGNEEAAAKFRGLWLTTANNFGNGPSSGPAASGPGAGGLATSSSSDALDDPTFLDKTFALLLLHDEKKIIAELEADPDETTTAMIEFVRLCKPTLSFHQLGAALTNGLLPTQVRRYAQHFIFWRRAVAIPPLHARDVYILSPNCSLSSLPTAAAAWVRAFPLAPPLPDFLADLSAQPRPYKFHCPSKNHRPQYLQMLAWLMRGGWVTQLCTFAYVIVWPEIQYEVEYQLEAEELRVASTLAQQQQQDYEDRSNRLMARGGGEQGTQQSGSGRASPAMARSVDNVLNSNNNSSSTSIINDDDSHDDDGIPPNHYDEDWYYNQATEPANPLHPIPFAFALPFPNSTTNSRPETPTGTESAVSEYDPSVVNSPLSPSRQAQINQLHRSTSPPISTTTPTTPFLFQPPPLPLPSSSSASTHTSTPVPSNPPTPTPLNQNQGLAERARLHRLADRAARSHAEKAAAFSRKRVPEATPHPSTNSAPHLASLAPYIIPDPRRATGRDSQYLSAIGRRLAGKDDGTVVGMKRLSNAWPVLWKYFNGRQALERIALLEDMKRKELWGLLGGMSEYLLCARHW